MSQVTASDLGERETLISEARREPSPILARGHYRRILDWIETLDPYNRLSEEVTSIASRGLADLAAMESNAKTRLDLRRQAIAHCRESLRGLYTPAIAIHLANRTVDLFYDRFAPEERVRIRSMLADAVQLLGQGISCCEDLPIAAELLVQKSSCLRCQGLISTRENRLARGIEAISCALKAVGLAPGMSSTHMALGQAHWASARWASSDDRYANSLNEAEQSLMDAQSGTDPLARLLLARFFRLTYRPAKAVGVFVEYEAMEENKRRLWNEAYIYGEAAMQLWYNTYDEELVGLHLGHARELLREAADAGYENARNFTCLALVEAALGQRDLAEETLKRLATGEAKTWLRIVREAMADLETGNVDTVKQGWALGLTDPRVWSSLGTYASEFIGDQDLAISLYEFGRQLGPADPIVLTNLARGLLQRAGPGDLAMAREYVSEAGRRADRGFVWWRDVRRRLAIAAGTEARLPKIRKRKAGDNRITRNELVVRLERFDKWTGPPSERGPAFQSWFIDLLNTTVGVTQVRPGYKLPRLTGTARPRTRDVDAAFRFGNSDYRVEVKWEGRPIRPSKISDFFSRLRTPGVTGLFVSMSGFTDGAIAEAWESLERERVRVLLMSGKEIRSVTEGRITLQMLREIKERHLSVTGRPFVEWTADEAVRKGAST